MLRFASGAVGTITSSCVLDRRHDVSLRLVSDSRLLDLRERALSDHELRIDPATASRSCAHARDPIAREDARVRRRPARRAHARVPVPVRRRAATHAAVCAADRSAREGGVVVDVATELANALQAPSRV
jgi:hypothetical protein